MVALHDDVVLKGHLPHPSMSRTSQDHFEMWSGIVRSRLGCNNNPDSFMFQVIYKHLLVKHELMPKRSGNCIPIDSTHLLAVAQEQRRSKEFIDLLDDTFIKQFNLDQERLDLSIVLDMSIENDFMIFKLFFFKLNQNTFLKLKIISASAIYHLKLK